MRILHVIPTIDIRDGGSPIACVSLCRELVRMGHDITLISTFIRGERDNWKGYTGDLSGVNVRCFPVFRGSYGVSPSLFGALGAAVKSADLVHIHGVYRFPLVAAAWWCSRYIVPYIVKPHGSLDPYVFKVRRWRKWPAEKFLIAPILTRANAVHFTAEEEMCLAASTGLFKPGNGKPVFNAVIVPEGVESAATDSAVGPGDFARLFPTTSGKRVILFLSRITYKKGLDILTKAFSIVSRRFPDAHLVIAGPDNEGYGVQVRRWIEAEGVAEHVTFTGMLVGNEIAAAYRDAAVFVLPSYTENFGLVVCEALSHSTPIVISNKVNIWREVAAAQAGIVTDCSASQVANAIGQVLADPDAARAMAERGSLLVRERFTANAMGRQMLTTYDQIINDRAIHSKTPLEAIRN